MKGDTKAVNYLERIDIEDGCNVDGKSFCSLHFSSVYTTYLCSYATDNSKTRMSWYGVESELKREEGRLIGNGRSSSCGTLWPRRLLVLLCEAAASHSFIHSLLTHSHPLASQWKSSVKPENNT